MTRPATRPASGLDEAVVVDFEAALRGPLIRPSDSAYAEARQVYNGMIDKRPGLIARCRDVADVISAVNFGRDNGLSVSILGGGHNAGGLGLCDDGLTIDLSEMKGIRVDPAAKTARVEPGCVWNEVDHATHAFGLAVPNGTISTTGVPGLALGGGIGHLTRRCGLTIDNILEADMVLADGSFVRAAPDENDDLYWAIRGGGGNFGVVTSFLFKCHDVDTVYAGPTFWPIEQAGEVMRWYRVFLPEARDELNGFFAFLKVPPAPPFPEELAGQTVCGVVWHYSGPLEEAEKAFEPVRAFGPPIFDHVGPVPHPAIQSVFDPLYPPGLQWYWRADFIEELTDEAIERHAEEGAKLPTGHSTSHYYPIDGAAGRVGGSETPWAYRDAKWAHVIVGVDPEPANAELITKWTVDFWEAVHPYSAGGAYVNFMMEEGEDRVRATYRENYDRLARVKAKYDPDNFFHVNQNVEPQA